MAHGEPKPYIGLHSTMPPSRALRASGASDGPSGQFATACLTWVGVCRSQMASPAESATGVDLAERPCASASSALPLVSHAELVELDWELPSGSRP